MRPNVNCSGTSTNHIILSLKCDVYHENNGIDVENISVHYTDDNHIAGDEITIHAIIMIEQCEDVECVDFYSLRLSKAKADVMI